MSQNGSGWPQDSWPPRDPRQAQDPRRRPPPGYQPLPHQPQPGQGRADDPSWRRDQRLPQPEPTGWHPGPPVTAHRGEDSRGAGGEEFYPRDQYGDPGYDPRDRGQYSGDAGYDDEYEAAGRFVPGFGADDDADDGGGRAEPGDGSGRGSRRRQKASRPGGGRPRGPDRRRRRFRWIAPLAALLVIVVPLAVGGAYGYHFYRDQYHPADYSGAGAGRVVIQVTSGETATGLAPALVKDGVVASSRAFVLAAEHSSSPGGLLPGFYAMRKQMKASLAYAALLNPNDLLQLTVTIPEGLRLTQTRDLLGKHSGISLAAYEKILKNPASLKLPGWANGKPEGYLFPATYEVAPHETALGVLTGMVQRFDQEAATINLTEAAKRVHLTPGQVITMASLVQAEGGRLSDYPKIARVIDNRLAQGTPLQLDSTVLYGLNTYGIIASDKQLNSPSPYNTYRHKGLTPGPIDNPGDAAIRAVLHPAAGNWTYFVTVNPKTGETLYTSSSAQFEQFRQELERNLAHG